MAGNCPPDIIIYIDLQKQTSNQENKNGAAGQSTYVTFGLVQSQVDLKIVLRC